MRGIFDPGYLNYTLGKLMILKLRDDYRGEQNGGFSVRAFHDRLLSYGAPPLPLLRDAMLKGASPTVIAVRETTYGKLSCGTLRRSRRPYLQPLPWPDAG